MGLRTSKDWQIVYLSSPNFGLDTDSRDSLLGGASVWGKALCLTRCSRAGTTPTKISRTCFQTMEEPQMYRDVYFSCKNTISWYPRYALHFKRCSWSCWWRIMANLRTYTKVTDRGYDELRHDPARMFGSKDSLNTSIMKTTPFLLVMMIRGSK